MSSSDVRSILNLPHAAGPSQTQPTRKSTTIKRPDGISRELYALIGDNAPSLADAHASVSAVRYRDRPKAKGPKARWYVYMNNHVLIGREWTGFTPSARADNPVKLAHWVRVSDEDPDASRE